MSELENKLQNYELLIGVLKMGTSSGIDRFHFTFKIPDGRFVINNADAAILDDVAYTISKLTKREHKTHTVNITFLDNDLNYGPMTTEQKEEFIGLIEKYKVEHKYPELKLTFSNYKPQQTF